MSKVRLDPIVFIARGYEVDSFENLPLHQVNKKYTSQCTIIALDNGHVRLEGLTKLDQGEHFRELKTKLKEMGYLILSYRHSGKEHTEILNEN